MFQKRLDDSDRKIIYGSSQVTLCSKDTGALGREYLVWERGLDEWTIAQFGLGFVPFSHDRFPGRIVMPIFDCYGDLIALSFRHIFQLIRTKDRDIIAIRPKFNGDSYSYTDEYGKDAVIPNSEVSGIIDPEPKYWNESFPKGEHLFGLQLAKYEIIRRGYAILVEGQFDVMMMHSLGFRNTIGLCGSAFTPVHAMLLRRWTKQIVIMLDGDRAGRNSALKIKDILDVYGFQAQRVETEKRKKFAPEPPKRTMLAHIKYALANLPEDTDPDSFLRAHGSHLMKRLIADAMAQASLVAPKE